MRSYGFWLNGEYIYTDKDGYLLDIEKWIPGVAERIACDLKIKLIEDHWILIEFAQAYNKKHGIMPRVRDIVKYLNSLDEAVQVDSEYVDDLFCGKSIEKLEKIIGRHKTWRCM